MNNQDRDIAILSLFLGTGMQVNDLSNLRMKDVDFTGNKISVMQNGGKKDTIAVTPSILADVQRDLDVRK